MNDDEKRTRLKVGRPPRGPKSGKGATLATRITAETRAALDEEAERTGRSVSQVAEIWLEDARKGRVQLHDLAGGDHALASAIQKLAEIARAVSENEPDPELARVALFAAWQSAISDVVPPAAANPSGLKTALEADTAWQACTAVWQHLIVASENDPVHQRAYRPLDEFTGPGGLIVLGTPALISELMNQKGRYPDQRTVHALEQLRAAGETAAAEIDAALPIVRAFVKTHTAALKRQDAARRLGKAIAVASTRVGH